MTWDNPHLLLEYPFHFEMLYITWQLAVLKSPNLLLSNFLSISSKIVLLIKDGNHFLPRAIWIFLTPFSGHKIQRTGRQTAEKHVPVPSRTRARPCGFVSLTQHSNWTLPTPEHIPDYLCFYKWMTLLTSCPCICFHLSQNALL